ncbi:unnamed protein product [Gemmata massiliana]|uniref:Uncharacterized protein n=1 Tax=Gemmata massiliana TaxID=1210884 RepID=A0A6P2D2K1_9BACT|nr:hypothetical protein [Gemmata massiliana]VTR94314.1 unnamed protein product [Gemmata massiliana]
MSELITATPTVEALAAGNDSIEVGGGGLPEITGGPPLDLLTTRALGGRYGLPSLCKPMGDEWLTMNIEAALDVMMHKHRIQGTEYDVEHYYFAPALQARVAHKLRLFRVIPYFSWSRERHDLFCTPIAARGKSRWTDTMMVLLNKSPEWHRGHQVNIAAADGYWDINELDLPGALPAWPEESTGRLLADALGTKRYVLDNQHPIIATITAGRPVR